MKKTKLEVALRKKKKILNIYDVIVMNRFSENFYIGLTDKEATEAEKIIEKKEVDISLLSEAFYLGDIDMGKIRYNNGCGKVWKNLNRKEFKLLRNYYSSPANVGDDNNADI